MKGASPLAALKGFDLVKGVAIDYMHNVLIGVVKALQDKWFHGDKHSPYYIGKKVLLYISITNDLDLAHSPCSYAIGNCRNMRRLGKSIVAFCLFEKLRYSNERSTKFESLYQEQK